jgi:trigger factor
MVDLEFDNIWAQRQAESENESEGAAEAAGAPGEAGEPGEKAPAAETSTEIPEPALADAAPGGEPGALAESAAATEAKDPGGEEDEAAKAEYRTIAERRVRLGLLLAEVGRSNNITVSQDELNQAITREVRRHPGYERQALDYYRQNPDAVASLRAPIFEDKVVDFIVELAKVPERKVTPQELLALPDPDAGDAVAADTPAGPP